MTISIEQFEELKKAVHDIAEQSKSELSSKEQMIDELRKQVEGLRASQAKVAFAAEGAGYTQKDLDTFNDKVYLASHILKKAPQDLNLYKNNPDLVKAMSTTNGAGGEWVPTELSSALIRMIEVIPGVYKLHRMINMPTNPYIYPVKTSSTIATLGTEVTTDSPTDITARTFTTDDLTFTAKKLVGRTIVSEEITEDALFDVMGNVQEDLAMSIARALDYSLINGDTAATHFDLGYTVAADDCRRAWIGYRRFGLTNAYYDCTGGNALTYDDIVGGRAVMGKYGINPSDLFFVTSISTYLGSLMNLKDASGNQIVTTVDKYGDKATVLTGELGRIMNIPIVVSEHCPDGVNASGIVAASGNTLKTMQLVNKNGIVFGNRRNVTVKSAEDIETDSRVVVATARYAMNYLYGTDAVLVNYFNFI